MKKINNLPILAVLKKSTEGVYLIFISPEKKKTNINNLTNKIIEYHKIYISYR